MDKKVIEEIKRIKELCGKINTINEALTFDDDEFDSEFGGEEMTPEEGMPAEAPAEEAPAAANDEDLINQIRKMALQGMSELADEPQGEKYQCIKKIWMLCDKYVTEDEKQGTDKQPQNPVQ